jgi:hypothetical protein
MNRWFAGLVALVLACFAANLDASHYWGGYHWARTQNPVKLQIGSNLTLDSWKVALGSKTSVGSAIYDWDASSVLDLSLVPGRSNRNCKPTAGRIEVCNAGYGYNGWLGIAQIWITGGVHITQAVTKVNDSYFNSAPYNTPAWRQLVMCQEVGHDFGLAHQDENFDNANMNTCMDYTSDPESNQHPNAHDYALLVDLYTHLDTTNTASAQLAANTPPAMGQIDFSSPGQWGRLMGQSQNGRHAVYELDFGNGNKVVTDVFWADPEHDHEH